MIIFKGGPFYISMYTFLLTLKFYNNEINKNNTEDTTKTCPCFSSLEKQGILSTGQKHKTKTFLKK